MRKKTFEKLLKEAIIQDAEEQGKSFAACEQQPVPADAQARFLLSTVNGMQGDARQTPGKQLAERPRFLLRTGRWLFHGLSIAVITAAIVAIILIGRPFGSKSANPKEVDEPPQAENTLEPLPEPGEQAPEPAEPLKPAEPVEIRAEDIIGTWTMWMPDNVDTDYRLTLRGDGTAKIESRIPLMDGFSVEGTYSIENSGIIVTFGDESMQAVYDPESDALLLFESETSWLTLYRNPDTYMIEHWFEMQKELLPKKTVSMEDLNGDWKLERAESAFSSFDLSGLSGYLSIEEGSFRYAMHLAGEEHSFTRTCSLVDSVMIETDNSEYRVKAVVDPDTNELKLCTLFYERELTEADPVLVFRKLSNAEQTMTQDALVGTWSEIKSLVGTWTMIDPTLSAQGYTLELVFESDEKVALNVSQSGKTSSVAFTYIITDNDVHLYMESYEVYPDGSIVKEKQEYYLFVSDGVMTYDLETDTLFVPNDEGGQTRFIRQAD